MEGDTLYSVKWYKNDHEFYRWVPNDRPKLQVFRTEGIQVDVSIYLALPLKVTKINYVSRNQLHNTEYIKWLSNFEFWLELAWLGERC